MKSVNQCFSEMNGTSHLSSEPTPGTLLSKFHAGTRNTYVLDLSTHNDHYAFALSNYMAVLCDIHNNQIAEYIHNNVITGIKFSRKEPSLLFTSSLDGKVNVWDSRCHTAVQTFLDDSDTGVPKPLLCFDFNSDEGFICAGTELIREDSFLLFWDRRSSKCLGGYWESHTADITQVRFHPSIHSCMASASVDGLMNVFDLNQGSEDEAITSTLNAGCAINKLSWANPDTLFCVTSLEECQLWSIEDASPSLSLSKDYLSSRFQFPVHCVVDSIRVTDTPYLATGANDGVVHLSPLSAKAVKPGCLLRSGHTDVVRAIAYNSQADIVLTGGEDSFVCQWKVT